MCVYVCFCVQVSVYLGRGGFSFQAPQVLTGSEVYARYGSAIAALGDLNMDGYNGVHTHTLIHMHIHAHTLPLTLLTISSLDVAISAPYGGAERHGLIYIHNGHPQGPDSVPSQVSFGAF